MTETTPPSSSTEAGEQDPVLESPRARVRKRWLLLAVGLGSVALAYGVGRVQGALALSRQEEEAGKDRVARQTQLQACQAERALLEARRGLSLVALSLDRRNFGVAETQRRHALRMLEQASAGGVPEASGVIALVRDLDLSVDPDPSGKRDGVVAASEALDQVVAARGPNAPVPAASP